MWKIIIVFLLHDLVKIWLFSKLLCGLQERRLMNKYRKWRFHSSSLCSGATSTSSGDTHLDRFIPQQRFNGNGNGMQPLTLWGMLPNIMAQFSFAITPCTVVLWRSQMILAALSCYFLPIYYMGILQSFQWQSPLGCLERLGWELEGWISERTEITESQKMLSWRGPIRIISSSSWPCAGHLRSHTMFQSHHWGHSW